MFGHLFLLSIFNLATSQRRITNGSIVEYDVNTNYLVYLVGANVDATFIGWMCGGCIIHPSLVLTSAACLYDVKLIYVIAGYRKYVETSKIGQDPCTSRMKKKITSFCVSNEYASTAQNYKTGTKDHIKYKWTLFDIGVARVDTPFDFYDSDYEKYCSYRPSSISVNFNTMYEEPGANVVTYGWGHMTYYRPAHVATDYNEIYLKYTSSVILAAEECKQHYKHAIIKARVGHVYICADGEGELDANGRFKHYDPPARSMCSDNFRVRDRRRQNIKDVNHTNTKDCKQDDGEIKSNNEHFRNTRRHGICQNDHGSPLVLWIGGRPYVVGIASAFQVNPSMRCVGPYLYSSVLCAGRFIHCMLQSQRKLTMPQNQRTISYCDYPDIERGFSMDENNITWAY